MSRVDNYLSRWIQLSGIQKNFESVKDLFLREQFIYSCSKEVSMFLRERNPQNSEEVVGLADTYLKAHGGHLTQTKRQTNTLTKSDKQTDNQGGPVHKTTRCFKCQELGHIANACPNRIGLPKQTQSEYSQGHLKRCFLCEKVGHLARDCRGFTKATQSTAALSHISQEQTECCMF